MKLENLKQTNCKCQLCKTMCQKTPCIGTPEDMAKIIEAGYADRLSFVKYEDGAMGFPVGYDLVGPGIKSDGSCIFFNNGLCELHEKGLKPILGKIAHHSDGTSTKSLRSVFERHKEIRKAWLSDLGKLLIHAYLS